jgi:uncharacterized protein
MNWAVVTGASSGIGLELAKLCAKDGYSVALVARREDRLQELSNELKKINPKIRTEVIKADLSEPTAAHEIFQRLHKLSPDVDILINNAGFGAAGAFPKPDLARQLEMIDLNVRALVELTGLFLPRMLVRSHGHILNVGSTAGYQPGPYMSIYYASKAFVNSFSEALHEETRGTGVTCTLLAPGPVHTEFGKVAQVDGARFFATKTAVSVEEVARTGYQAMFRNEPIAIPGLSAKLIPQMARISPRSVSRRIAGWLNRSVQP